MLKFQISFMENNDMQESDKILSIAMLNNPLHLGVFLGDSENERSKIETMFFELLNTSPGIVFLAKEHENIIEFLRFNSYLQRWPKGCMVKESPEER